MMATIAFIGDVSSGLEQAFQGRGHQVTRFSKLPPKKMLPVDLIIVQDPRKGWVESLLRRGPSFLTLALLAIKSGGVRARVGLIKKGVDRCFDPSEGPTVVVAHAESLVRMISRSREL